MKKKKPTSLPAALGVWKAAWREFGGKRYYYRSKWEANYGRYLEWLKANGQIQDWLHEPKTFWFEKIQRGCRSYLPDFCVTENDGRQIYHEVKGWLDGKSKTKIKRMRIYHPEITLLLIDAKSYQALARQLDKMIPGWE